MELYLYHTKRLDIDARENVETLKMLEVKS